MTAPPPISRRPYLLRAMHQWMSDSGFTPHVIVNAEVAEAKLPRAYARDGKIVLNISYTATEHLDIANDWVSFQARFDGVAQHVRFPLGAVLGVYARETGEGMVFSEQDDDSQPPDMPPAAPTTPTLTTEAPRRPRLKIVK